MYRILNKNGLLVDDLCAINYICPEFLLIWLKLGVKQSWLNTFQTYFWTSARGRFYELRVDYPNQGWKNSYHFESNRQWVQGQKLCQGQSLCRKRLIKYRPLLTDHKCLLNTGPAKIRVRIKQSLVIIEWKSYDTIIQCIKTKLFVCFKILFYKGQRSDGRFLYSTNFLT